jgi:effector-binding domain-containing protein
MSEQPEITERPAKPYVAIAATVTMATLGTVVPPLNGEVFAWLAARGIAPAGPPFWRYTVVDMEHELEVEAGTPVAAPVAGDDGRVVAGVLPAGRYVTMHHVGHPESLADATGRLLSWAEAKGLRFDTDGTRWGCRLESYLTDPATQPDMTKWETVLSFRLAG